MKLKTADFLLQLGFFLLTGVALAISNYEVLNPLPFIAGISIVQFISLILHTAVKKQEWKLSKWRTAHAWGIVIGILLIVISVAQGSTARTGDKDDKYNMAGAGTGILAIAVGIFLVAFYFIITWSEWIRMRKK